VITRELLVRAWLFMGCISAVLVMAGFGYVLWRAGWRPGDPVGSHSEWHHAYRQATTATWVGVVSCQVGTAFAARVDRASLREIGLFGNRLLLWGIAFELTFAAAIIWLPPLQAVFGTAPLSWDTLCLIGTYPVLVCGADEFRRWRRRARDLASDTVHHSLTEGES
jgi:magnesium-transporting ATPase (P-type)